MYFPLKIMLVCVGLLLVTGSAMAGQPRGPGSWLAGGGQPVFRQPDICPVRKSRRHGYRVCTDQSILLGQALERARRDGKLLIVKFGADWCPWCRKLHKVMPSGKVLGYGKDGFGYGKHFALVEIATSSLDRKRGMVQVPTGQQLSDSLLKMLGVPRERVNGIPYLLVLDPEKPGKGLYRDSKDLETSFLGYNYRGVSYDPAAIRYMLKKAWQILRGT